MTSTPVSHRRDRRRRTQAERDILEQVRAALAVPLVFLAALLCFAVLAWQIAGLSVGTLLIGLASGLVAAAILGAIRAQRATAVLQRAHEAELAAVQKAGEEALQRVTDAATAVEKTLLWTADELCRGGRPSVPDRLPPIEGEGPAAEAVGLLTEVQVQAVEALIRVQEQSQSAVLVEMLRLLSRREHALVSRALEALTELQKLTDDPELLDYTFQIDHLVTRMRRMVESKAVLSGESLRSTRSPLSVLTVLRGATSEVRQYARVGVAAGTVGSELALPGHAGPDLSHLVAELIENATELSPPETRVMVRAERVPKGLAIEVEDRSVLMTPELRQRANRLLAGPDRGDISRQLREGHLGLITAASIARRHHMSVTLQQNPAGGTTAQVIVPDRLLVPIAAPNVVPATGQAAAPPAQAQPLPAAPPSPPAPTAPPAPSPRQSQPAPGAAGRPQLPRRRAERLPIPEREQPTPSSTRAASPGLAAAFLRGSQAGRPEAAGEPPQSGRPGDPPAARP
ncbi:sensor histidine kinase [Streptomyces sp. NPDC002787]